MTKGKLVLVLIISLLIALYIYFHPSSEVMSCNKSLECKVSHKFLGILDIKTGIDLSKNSYMTGRAKLKSCTRYAPHSCTYVVYPLITDANNKVRSPFIYYYTSSEDEDFNNAIGFEINQFKSYVNNPEIGFSMEAASGNWLFIFTICFAALGFLCYYIFNFIENLFKKLFKR